MTFGPGPLMACLLAIVWLPACALAAPATPDPAFDEVKELVGCKPGSGTESCIPYGARPQMQSLAECFKQFAFAESRKTNCALDPLKKITTELPKVMESFLAQVPQAVREKYLPDGKKMNLTEIIGAVMKAAKETTGLGYESSELGKQKNKLVSLLLHFAVRKSAALKLGAAPDAVPGFSWPSIATIDFRNKKADPDVIEITVTEERDPYTGIPVSGDSKKKAPRKKNDVGAYLFGEQGCGGSTANCFLDLGNGVLTAGLGLTVHCLNREVCTRSSELAFEHVAMIYESITPKYVSMAQAELAGDWILIEARYKRLREELLNRVLRQIGAIMAAESASCDSDLAALRAKWKAKAAACKGVDGAGAFAQAMGSSDAIAQHKAICRAGAGGDASARAAHGERLKSDIHSLLIERCAYKYLKGFPQGLGSAKDVDDYQLDFKDGDCARVWTAAIDRAGTISGVSLRTPMSKDEDYERTTPDNGKSLHEVVMNNADDMLACYETAISPRIADESIGGLSLLDEGGKKPMAFSETPAFENLTTLFDRACATPGSGSKVDAMGLHELEALVGPSVPRPKSDSPAFDGRYERLLGCNKDDTGSTAEQVFTNLDRACTAFGAATALPPVAAAAGPEGVAAIVAVDVACVIPPAVVAGIKHSEKNRIIGLRRAMGNQLSCDQAAGLARDASKLDAEVDATLLHTAVRIGFTALELGGLLSKAATVQPPLSSAAEANRLLKEAIAARKELQAAADVKELAASVQELEASKFLAGIKSAASRERASALIAELKEIRNPTKELLADLKKLSELKGDEGELNAALDAIEKKYLPYSPAGDGIKGASGPLKPKVAMYNPENDMYNCVACTTAYLRNKFHRQMIDTAESVQGKFGPASIEQHFDLDGALSYIQKATGSTASAKPVGFMSANAPAGDYAIFYKDADSYTHVVAAWISSTGRKFVFDTQIGRAIELKTVADWTALLKRYKAIGATPYKFSPN